VNKPVKTRPDRYLAQEQALAYHARTNADGRPTLSQRLELRAVRHALAQATPGNSVLDAPCGTGRIDMELRQRFANVTGIDSSTSMLSVYQRALPERAGCCSDIFHLPFEDGGFDWVVCHRYFHHLHSHRERVELLTSLARVSRFGVVFYAWLDTVFTKRRSSMRASIPRTEVLRAIEDSGLVLQHIHRCAGPFSVKALLVCARRA
jgi:ubiquinone/menaquinone biosynthesis C-methylase UbiE